MQTTPYAMESRHALLIVDPQLDFMPNGALAVPKGDEILPILNEWIQVAHEREIPVVVSRDWHPSNHISFKERGGPWPPHCIQNTPGAAFHPDLLLPDDAIIINKAFLPDQEAYSAFEGVVADTTMPLSDQLRQLFVNHVWIAGLATDYCVYHTGIDAREFGFSFHVLLPACRGIDPTSTQEAILHLQKLGVVLEL